MTIFRQTTPHGFTVPKDGKNPRLRRYVDVHYVGVDDDGTLESEMVTKFAELQGNIQDGETPARLPNGEHNSLQGSFPFFVEMKGGPLAEAIWGRRSWDDIEVGYWAKGLLQDDIEQAERVTHEYYTILLNGFRESFGEFRRREKAFYGENSFFMKGEDGKVQVSLSTVDPRGARQEAKIVAPRVRTEDAYEEPKSESEPGDEDSRNEDFSDEGSNDEEENKSFHSAREQETPKGKGPEEQGKKKGEKRELSEGEKGKAEGKDSKRAKQGE